MDWNTNKSRYFNLHATSTMRAGRKVAVITYRSAYRSRQFHRAFSGWNLTGQ